MKIFKVLVVIAPKIDCRVILSFPPELKYSCKSKFKINYFDFTGCKTVSRIKKIPSSELNDEGQVTKSKDFSSVFVTMSGPMKIFRASFVLQLKLITGSSYF